VALGRRGAVVPTEKILRGNLSFSMGQ